MLLLREICLDSELEEVKKWWQPCYSYQGTNLIIIGSFKEFCTISFFKGVLLSDPENILQFAGPNTKSAKIIKFKSVNEIEAFKPVLKKYIAETIKLEKEGKKVDFKSNSELEIPEELTNYFKLYPNFEKAFGELTPGRQRSWLLHFSSAKQSKTKVARIEKSTEKIKQGKGANEY